MESRKFYIIIGKIVFTYIYVISTFIYYILLFDIILETLSFGSNFLNPNVGCVRFGTVRYNPTLT